MQTLARVQIEGEFGKVVTKAAIKPANFSQLLFNGKLDGKIDRKKISGEFP